MDFTVKKYEELIKTISDLGIKTYTIQEWFKKNPSKGIVIRHDIDRRANNAISIAELENKHGIKATYYFRITKGSFKSEVIKKVKSLGHEVGYHYEDLSIAKGDCDKAIALFQEHLKMFEGLADIKTIAMHGSPLSKHDNRDIWKKKDFKKYGIEAEAFLSIDYKDIYYFTDTGRSWNSTSNLRDKVESELDSQVNNTDQLIAFITEDKSKKIALVSHPERWDDKLLPWISSYLKDQISNVIKLLMKKLLRWK